MGGVHFIRRAMIKIDQQDAVKMYYNNLMRRDHSIECLVANSVNYEFMRKHNTFMRETCKE